MIDPIVVIGLLALIAGGGTIAVDYLVLRQVRRLDSTKRAARDPAPAANPVEAEENKRSS